MKHTDVRLAGSAAQPKRWSLTSAAAIGLMIFLQLPLGGYLSPGSGLAAMVGREVVVWALTAILLAYVLLIERRPLASVGWRRPSWKTLAFGLGGAVVMVAGMALIYLVVYPALGLSSTEGGLSAVQALPGWFRLMLILRPRFSRSFAIAAS